MNVKTNCQRSVENIFPLVCCRVAGNHETVKLDGKKTTLLKQRMIKTNEFSFKSDDFKCLTFRICPSMMWCWFLNDRGWFLRGYKLGSSSNVVIRMSEMRNLTNFWGYVDTRDLTFQLDFVMMFHAIWLQVEVQIVTVCVCFEKLLLLDFFLLFLIIMMFLKSLSSTRIGHT